MHIDPTQTNDTICALSTANGMGAIALIRLSGKNAIAIFEKIFSKSLSDKDTHTVHFGRILAADGHIVDEVVVSLFLGNKSFTGETTLEIACHGSIFIQQEILQLLLSNGARLAKAGEFTMRAFLNGKMDLSQAEAVGDLIASESAKAHRIAMNQMRGSFSNELRELREKLINFASLVELELDFAEEDVEFADRTQLRQLVDEVLSYLARLIKSFQLGNAIKKGVPVAIVGAPNTGKSTLLNQLLGEDRAIVSNIAGTTRDVIEETINISGILFRLIDTAGIRDNAETIEAIGIEKSKQKIAQADIVLVLSDYSASASAAEGHWTMSTEEAIKWAEELQDEFTDKRFIVLANKLDLRTAAENAIVSTIPMLSISAKEGKGMDALKDLMVEWIQRDFDLAQETIVTNIRHVEALEKALLNLERAKHALDTNITGDFIAMDIRQAMFDIGSITGDISTEDLLGNIFSKFCIGK